MQTSFLRNKVLRQIEYNGREFHFTHIGEDQYHQPNIANPIDITIKGIFHESISYVSETKTDAGRMVSKPQPMILALYEDAKQLSVDDRVTIGDNTFSVTSITDVGNLKITGDISLRKIV